MVTCNVNLTVVRCAGQPSVLCVCHFESKYIKPILFMINIAPIKK